MLPDTLQDPCRAPNALTGLASLERSHPVKMKTGHTLNPDHATNTSSGKARDQLSALDGKMIAVAQLQTQAAQTLIENHAVEPAEPKRAIAVFDEHVTHLTVQQGGLRKHTHFKAAPVVENSMSTATIPGVPIDRDVTGAVRPFRLSHLPVPLDDQRIHISLNTLNFAERQAAARPRQQPIER